jgi:hypothetical protein
LNRDDLESYIRVRAMQLMFVFGKKQNSEMARVFSEVLIHYPESVLMKAFSRAERECERMPTPKVMRALCNEEMPSQAWQYDFKRGIDPNRIPCLIDPTGKGDKKFMYRAEDCPEGRAFLAKLREIQKNPPEPKINYELMRKIGIGLPDRMKRGGA